MKTGDFVVYIVTLMAPKAADSGAKHKTARLLRQRFSLSSSFFFSSPSTLNKSLSFMVINDEQEAYKTLKRRENRDSMR